MYHPLTSFKALFLKILKGGFLGYLKQTLMIWGLIQYGCFSAIFVLVPILPPLLNGDQEIVYSLSARLQALKGKYD